MYCSSCGTKNPDHAAFCCTCGNKLVHSSENTVQTAEPESSNDSTAKRKHDTKTPLNKTIKRILAAVGILVLVVILLPDGDDNSIDADMGANHAPTEEFRQEDSEQNTSNTLLPEKRLASPLSYDAASNFPSADSGEFQSLEEFCGDALSVSIPKNNGTYFSFDFKGSEEDLDILLAYCELLGKDEMHFTQAEEKIDDYRGKLGPYSSSSNHYIYAAGYTYTGNAVVTKSQIAINEKCSLIVLFTISKYGGLEGFVAYDITLKAVDLGLRANGGTADISPCGPSACAGLIRTAYGEYETDDGRLCVSPGEIVLLEDGEKKTANVIYKLTDTNYHIEIYDSSNTRCTCVVIPNEYFKSGAVFKNMGLACESSAHDTYGPDLIRRNPTIFRFLSGKYYTPCTQDDNMYNSATVRIMYMDESEDIMVLYIYSEFITEQEAFFALKLSERTPYETDSNTDSSSSGTHFSRDNNTRACSTCGGDGWIDCQRCDGDGWIEYYEYSGGGIGSQGDKTKRSCDSTGCIGGKKHCPTC